MNKGTEGHGEDPSPDIDQIRDFYDRVYHAESSVDGDSGMRNHYRRLADHIGIRSGQKLLDVACGSGGWLNLCHERGLNVAGVDLSERAIAVCKQRLPNGEFYAQPAETLPFDDARFDVVTCLGSLEHFVDPVGALQEMVRVATPDATFIILVPNEDFLTRKLGLFSGTYQVDAKEVVRSLDGWVHLFHEGGLSVESRWRDLHVLNRGWITRGSVTAWPFRLFQALALTVWPLKWQYQVYHQCKRL